MTPRAVWPHVRAVLVTMHVTAVVLVAMPAPSGTATLLPPQDPRFAAEVHPWAQLIGVSDQVFASDAEAVRTRWMDTRGSVLAPFDVYLACVGAPQPWDMFSAPNRTPSRFVLEMRATAARDAESGWSFLSGLPPGDWRRPFFDSERVRSLLNNIGRARNWTLADGVCDYLAREAMRDEASIAQARCRFVSSASPSWRGVAPPDLTPQIEYSRVVDRER